MMTGGGPTGNSAIEDRPLPSAERLQELLFDAATIGRDDVLPALIHAGADPTARDPRGYTPLILASYNGREAATRFLLDQGRAGERAG